jgi:hypothetical protein
MIPPEKRLQRGVRNGSPKSRATMRIVGQGFDRKLVADEVLTKVI